MPANVYMSLYGADANNGLSPATAVRTFARACGLLANRPGYQQTIWIAGGPNKATPYVYGTLNGNPERWIHSGQKHGTPDGWIVVRNMPGSFIRLAPTPPVGDLVHQCVVQISDVNYWAVIWEYDDSTPFGYLDVSQQHFELNGGCEGRLSTNGQVYTGSNYVPTAGAYIRGYSGAIIGSGATVTNGELIGAPTGAYWEGGHILNTKYSGVTIQNIRGPICMRGIVSEHAVMGNILDWHASYGNNGTAASYTGASLALAGLATQGSQDQLLMPGPALIERVAVVDAYGETVTWFSYADVIIQDCITSRPHRVAAYGNQSERFVVRRNMDLYPSDAPPTPRVGNGFAVGSERSQKPIRTGLITHNLVFGLNTGMVCGFSLQESLTSRARDILFAHNTILDVDDRAIGTWGDTIEPSVVFQNNVFGSRAGPIDGFGAALGTQRGNRWNRTPTKAGLLAGTNNAVLNDVAMKLSRATPTTEAAFTREYFRPLADSPLLGAGTPINAADIPVHVDDAGMTLFGKPFARVVLGTGPLTDLDGRALRAIPSIGAYQFALAPAAVVTIEPSTGLNDAATAVTVTGSGFSGATAVQLSDPAQTHLTGLSVTSDTEIHASVPAGIAPGAYGLVIVTAAGESAPSTTHFTVAAAVPAPVVTSVVPATVYADAPTAVTIYGSHLAGATAAHLSDTAGTALSTVAVVNDGQLTATVPAGVAVGTYQVRVTTLGGTNATSAVPMQVQPPLIAPVVESIVPTSGAAGAAVAVVITGSGFTGATEVSLVGATNEVLEQVVVLTAGRIAAVVPQGLPAGTYEVQVTTPEGISQEDVDYRVDAVVIDPPPDPDPEPPVTGVVTARPARVHVDATSRIMFAGPANRVIEWVVTGPATIAPAVSRTNARGATTAILTPDPGSAGQQVEVTARYVM